MSNSPIVITGAGGPLGQELIAQLVPRYRIVGLTRRPSLEGLRNAPGLVYRGWNYLEEPDEHRFQAVVHLAAFVDFSWALGSVLNCVNANILKTADLVRFAHRCRIPRLIYTSTVSVYHEDGQSPKSEDSPVGPSTVYAASKWMGELVVQAAQDDGTETVILRFAGIYGQPNRSDPVLNRFIQQALRREPIRVLAPQRKRDYIYLKDAARACALAIESKAVGIFHVATGTGIAFLEMAQQVCRILGGRFEVSPDDIGQGSPELVYEVSRARKHLNFQCQYSLERALEDIRARITVL